jgi:hypothetical protein
VSGDLELHIQAAQANQLRGSQPAGSPRRSRHDRGDRSTCARR